jgi:monoamine oxidase
MGKAGYQVSVLAYQDRPGGQNYTVLGGDMIKEVGGAVQKMNFAPGNSLNPGPWRIPFHHEALLHYIREFGVAAEPFIQINLNGYIHSDKIYRGKPHRIAEAGMDFKGHVAELLAKAVNNSALGDTVTTQDKQRLLEVMRGWGMRDKDMAYTSSLQTSAQRSYDRPPGGGVDGALTPSQVASLSDVLDSRVWQTVSGFFNRTQQLTMFQPAGGIDMIGKAFARQAQGNIRLNS